MAPPAPTNSAGSTRTRNRRTSPHPSPRTPAAAQLTGPAVLPPPPPRGPPRRRRFPASHSFPPPADGPGLLAERAVGRLGEGVQHRPRVGEAQEDRHVRRVGGRAGPVEQPSQRPQQGGG